MAESSAHGATLEKNGRDGDGTRRVSFSDVARAHYVWDVAARGTETRQRARKEFNDTLALFEKQSKAKVVETYFCQKQASAVALAQADQPRPGVVGRLISRIAPREEVPDFRLYRVTDWVTADLRKLADLLHECDILAIKATWGLEGFQRAVVMQWLLAVEEHILGFIESGWKREADAGEASDLRADEAGPEATSGRVERSMEKQRQAVSARLGSAAAGGVEGFHQRTHAELNKVEDYYHEAGAKRGRLNYLGGMLWIGIPLVAVTAVVAGLIFWLFGLPVLHSVESRRFFACMAAGAIGAVVSVLMRMSGSRGGFTIDHEIGKAGVRRLGAFRPLIGAVSGVIVSFLLQTPLLPFDEKDLTIQLFIVVAFLAGFSERWTQVVLSGAMRTIEPMDDKEGTAKSTTPPGAR